MAYLFDHGWKTEHERLTRLGATLDSVTIQHLETIGVTTGWRCLEVGAGAGSMAAWLCRRVGAQGHVVATDLDVKFLAALDSPNLEIRHHDIVHDPLEPAAFDLVHARSVLEHLAGRDAALAKMVAALKPGGWLLVEDPGLGVIPSRGQRPDRRIRAGVAAVLCAREAGRVEPYYARTLGTTLRRHGLRDVQCVGGGGSLSGVGRGQRPHCSSSPFSDYAIPPWRRGASPRRKPTRSWRCWRPPTSQP